MIAKIRARILDSGEYEIELLLKNLMSLVSP